MNTEDEIRRTLHPDVEQARAAYKPMEYNPKPRPRIPQAAEQPQAAEPCIDPDEIGGKSWYQEQPEPWWPYILGGVCAILALVLIFVPMGMK